MRRVPPTTVVIAAALAARLALLGVVVAAAARLDGEAFDSVVYLLAVFAGAQTLLDPGLNLLYVARWPLLDAAGRPRLWRTALRVQVVASSLVAASGIGIAVATDARSSVLTAACGLGVLTAVESTVRFARSPWHASQQFTRYAAVDVSIAIGRASTALVLAVAGATAFAAANVIVAALLLAWMALVVPRGDGRREPFWSVARATLPYGASTAFSALYAYAPVILLGLVGDLRAAAVVAVVSRLTQPAELVPAAIANVHLPRLAPCAKRGAVFRRQVVIAAFAGAAAAAAVTIAAPVVLPWLGVAFRDAAAVVALLALSLPIKFVNYQLVALAIASQRIVPRAIASAMVAAFAVVATIAAAPAGAPAVAAVVLTSELLLLVALTVVSTSRPKSPAAAASFR